MSKVMKAYKFRLYPNTEQESTLVQWIGCGRWIWNHMLEVNKSTYEKNKEFVFHTDMTTLLPLLKKQEDTVWLAEAPSQVLQYKCKELSDAIGVSFKRQDRGFPKFKAKHKDQSGIRFPQGWHIHGNRINLPKMKGIKFKQHRPIEGVMKSCVVNKDRCGDWWISIFTANPQPEQKDINPDLSVGIDVGLKEFAVTSDGEVINNPRFLRKSEKKLKQTQRAFSRSTPKSNNREKKRVALARAHRKVTRQRTDFINKFVSSITKMNDIICIEDLNISGMKKNHKLAKSICDVSWGHMFNRLQQKCNDQGKLLLKVDQFAPTSKTCSCCGSVQDMPLSVRTYSCKICGLEIDRDFNAALNIRDWAIRHKLNAPTAGTAESYACGDMKISGSSAQEAADPSDRQ